MWKAVICVALLMVGCARGEQKEEVALPKVAPDTVVASWSVISRTSDRNSLFVALDGSRTLNVTTRSANGTMMNVSRTVSEKDYAKLVGRLRALDCCSLPSTTKERTSPSEAKPRLEIDFGDMKCGIELWDREWREGRARECGFAVARLHGTGFVPDPPVDEPSP